MEHAFHRSAVAAGFYTFLCFTSGNTWAQALHAEDAHRLDEVTITARNLEKSAFLTPAQQLSGAALTQRQGSTLGETLDQLPGIANGSFGPNVGRPIIRGMDGDRIRILQNSGANMDVSGLSNDHAVPIDPLTTERIEVLRGPATLLHGGSAIGGVVNVIDNRIARERTFDAQGGVVGKVEMRAGGAAQERSTGAMVEAGNDKFVLHVDAFERSTQNLRVPKSMSCDGTPHGRRVCNSASNSQGAAVGGTLLFDRGYLGLSTSEYRSNYGTVAEPGVTIGLQRRHHAIEGVLRGVGLFESLKLQLGQTRYTHTEYEGAEAGTRFDTSGYDWRVEAHQQALRLSSGTQLEGVVGFQRDSNTLSATGSERFLPSSRSQSMGIFTYQALKTPWGQVSAGARADTVDVAAREAIGPNNDNVAQTKQFKPLSLSVGAMRNLRQRSGDSDAPSGWQLTTNLSASQRAPKDYELFAHGQHVATAAYEMGQPNQGLEKGTQLDVGGEWKQGPHQFGITGFVSQFSNYLALRPTGEGWDGVGFVTPAGSAMPVYRFEGVRARFYGIESTAKVRMVGGQAAWLSPNAAHGAMDLELKADVVRAHDTTHNSHLPRIAPMRVGADAVWSRQAWGARLGFMHAAAQSRVPNIGLEPSVATAAHTLWHAGLNYRAHAAGPTHWLLFAKLDNITNQLAYSSTSVLTQTMRENAPPVAGRSVKVGVQVSF